MKKINKVLSITILTIVMLLNGCVSHMVLEDSREKVALRQAIELNDKNTIKAIKLGDDGVGLGIDLLSLDVITEQPLKQIGAAIADAAILYGTYEGLVWLNDEVNNNSGSDSGSQTSGRDSNRISVNGNDNSVHVGDEIITISE